MSGIRRLKRKKEQRSRVSDSLYYHMTDEHSDLLQYIEFALVSAYRNDPKIDDKEVATALKSAITGTESEGEVVSLLMEYLSEVRHLRADISDDLWIDGLKVVLGSVRNHSTVRSGDQGYLNFIQSFLP